MSQENTTVIVTHQRLNEAITKALRQDPNAIIDAAQAPPPGGYEADETPPSAVEATELVTTPPAKAGGFFRKAGFNSGFLRNA
jgi:hypothetical protein